ncbi:rhamnan synthesis F family protein [Synechococcus sp. BA-132 BA5]|uniref:rhamnan synthesis F family protein n=1 Tax=Synechococcus sp. BA-132 BA5 TaxID=3110252 RepID=UPI002B215B23|nr:rhamnan synthesis F family protein [Synechococcus sp. BA-132 BA5]MEA5415574.1 rhamnan synthesis F family protein [Synechococcus sp. BA-132 BA5]
MSTAKQVSSFAAAGNPKILAEIINNACTRNYPQTLIESLALTALSSYSQSHNATKEETRTFLASIIRELHGYTPTDEEFGGQFICGKHIYPARTTSSAFTKRLCEIASDKHNKRAISVTTSDTKETETLSGDNQSLPTWLHEAEARGLFNSYFYRKTNPDLGHEVNIHTHFQERSLNEPNRDPSQHFSVSQYYLHYPDVRNAGINALQHYIEHGADRHRFPSDKIQNELTRHVSSLDMNSLRPPDSFTLNDKSIAIAAHIHYPDVLARYISIFKATQAFSDLVITTTSYSNKEEIENILRSNDFTRSTVHVYAENKGRDLGAYFAVAYDIIAKYDYVCKIHAKKSPHLGAFGESWSEYLLMATMGNENVVRNAVWLLSSNPDIGVLAPIPYAHATDNTWDSNFDLASEMCDMLGICNISEAYPEGLRYPSATVFWHQPKCLAPIREKIRPDFFPPEPLPIDGTRAHALERLIPALAHTNGFSTVYYRVPSLALSSTEEWKIMRWINCCADTNPVIIVGNDASNTGAPRTALALQRAIRMGERHQCLVVLLGGGPLVKDYTSTGDTFLFENGISNENVGDVFKYTDKKCIIVTNTVVTAEVGRVAKEYGHIHIALIHEHATTGYWHKDLFRHALCADFCIFPGARMVSAAISYAGIVGEGNISIMPQGLYRDDFPSVGYRESYSSVRAELELPKDSLIVLGCGTIERRKGVDRFIEIAKIFDQRYHSKVNNMSVYFLWIGGLPPNTDREKKWAITLIDNLKDIGLSNVYFLGSCICSDRYFAASDLFFLPSRFDPFPGVVLEAMACAKPIICFKGSTDVDAAFDDGMGGLSLDTDYDLVATEIHRLLGNKKMQQRMGEWNKRKVHAKYLFKHYANEIISLADSVISVVPASKPAKSSKRPISALASIIVPAYKTRPMYLQQLVDSLLRQSYANWELCISCSALPMDSRSYLVAMANADSRIKPVFIDKTVGISSNTNAAIAISEGDYILFVDHDDLLPSFCIEEIIDYHEIEDADLVYTAEDKVDKSGRRFYAPVFKHEYSEAALMRNNYITHIVSIGRRLLDEIGGLNSDYDGAQDYDFILRATESARKIVYLDNILYHWRVFEESTSSGDAAAKPYAIEAGRRALEAHLKRNGISNSYVTNGRLPFTYEVIETTMPSENS